MFGGVIRKRVMEKVEERIKGAEMEYIQGCKDLESKLDDHVTSLVERCENDKENLADALVHDIVSKIL